MSKHRTIHLKDLKADLEALFEKKMFFETKRLRLQLEKFQNLCQQLMDSNYNILQCALQQAEKEKDEQKKKQNKEKIEPLKISVERTILILKRLVDTFLENGSIKITLTTLYNFLKNFVENLNILCTYFHSISHNQFAQSLKLSKQILIQGINKLYNSHNSIQSQFNSLYPFLIHSDTQISIIVTQMQNVKQSRCAIEGNQRQLKECWQKSVVNFLQFCSTSLSKQPTDLSSSTQSTQKKLLCAYIKILEELFENQWVLEGKLGPILEFCEKVREGKGRKGGGGVVEGINLFTRIVAQLLRNNHGSKSKKIKLEDLNKALGVILLEIINTDKPRIGLIASAFGITQGKDASKMQGDKNRKSKDKNEKSKSMNKTLKPKSKSSSFDSFPLDSCPPSSTFIDEILHQVSQICNTIFVYLKQIQKIESSGILQLLPQYKEICQWVQEHKEVGERGEEVGGWGGRWRGWKSMVRKLEATVQEIYYQEFEQLVWICQCQNCGEEEEEQSQ